MPDAPIPSGSTHLSAAQRRKLRHLLTGAFRHVPFYRDLYRGAGLAEADMADPGVLARLPVVTKNDLLDAAPDARIDARIDPAALPTEATTGSTGQPFALQMDRRYVRRRNRRFLRALLSAGYRPWRRLMLLTDRHSQSVVRRGLRWYVSVEQPVDAIASAYERIGPDTLYGLTTPLRLLGERTGIVAAHRPRLVVSTAEMLDAGARADLERAFACPVADFYGMTETGLAAWRNPGAGAYTVAADAVLMELAAIADQPGRHRVIVTNLDLRASPVIRYDSGDVAAADGEGGRLRVRAFEGRRIDAVVGRDGRRLSPYQVTDALRDLPGLRRFRVTQESLTDFLVAVEASGDGAERLAPGVRETLERLLGPGLSIDVRIEPRLAGDGTVKFRPVESRVADP